ncbi:methyltransferase family protein [Rubinisphaera margarita]|uniref:methyltransferase family protein n=1 Tax=Rubinisphaera margarita TaxID=2909586 RepID=UPI001EE790F3|nr:isoprenylcysteine carboxylmethyltransferase family protein [Rubinisphaera margarita]MCG6155560.1 isoprenylcysteine carboxylmethyltransferase family protein [Rubinisphaera margarita]
MSRRLSWMLVVLQTVLAAVLFLTLPWQSMTVWHWTAVVLGALLLIWAVLTMRLRYVSVLPELRANARLVANGPYRWLRHPMYSALALSSVATIVPDLFSWRTVVWIALMFVLDTKARREEAALHARFPDYGEFCRTRWRWIPFLY